MEATQVDCGQCGQALPESHLHSGSFNTCPHCQRNGRVELFPAYFGENLVPTTNLALLDEAEASCFYHPRKQAAVVCEGCGRFICGLCDVEVNGQHLCPGCLENGRKKKKIRNLENERILYDNLAASLSILALLAWPITLVTAPASLYIVIKHWKSPGSLIPRSRIRFLLAGLFAVLEIAAWTTAFIILANRK